MFKTRTVGHFLIVGLLVSVPVTSSDAAESAFSAYGLGGNGFGAGVAPPPGAYLTPIASYYEGDISGNVTFGGAAFNVGLDVDFYAAALNLLLVPRDTFLGGNLGFSVTVPVGYLDVAAGLTGPGGQTVERTTEGFGLGDTVGRAQLGWHHGDFHHMIYVQGLVPTGRYDVGFNPNIGLNRPAVDFGWAFTWVEPSTKLQFNGAAGFTYSFENEATNYKSGNDLHFEWAIGRDFGGGLTLGIVGYDYRQLTGDSGSGATLGPFKGKVDAIGPGLSYSTVIGSTPFILNARHYQEFNAEHRYDGSLTILTGTFVF